MGRAALMTCSKGSSRTILVAINKRWMLSSGARIDPQRPDGCQDGTQIDQRSAKRRSGSQVGFRSWFFESTDILFQTVGVTGTVWFPFSRPLDFEGVPI